MRACKVLGFRRTGCPCSQITEVNKLTHEAIKKAGGALALLARGVQVFSIILKLAETASGIL